MLFSAALRWLECWGCSGRIEHVRPIGKWKKGPSKFPHRSAFSSRQWPQQALIRRGVGFQLCSTPYPDTNLPALGNLEKRAGKEQGGIKQGWPVGWCLVANSARDAG